MRRGSLPQLSGELFLADSGLETDLIFHEGLDLPEFAAFVLLDDTRGQAALDAYFRRHADIAARYGRGVVLESPTWRASSDWGERLGYPPAELRRVNQSAVDLLAAIRDGSGEQAANVVISGCVGPRAEGYRAAEQMTDAEAERYHHGQVEVLAAAGADMVHAMTIAYPAEATGIARAAARCGIPAAISFTTETDGRLPDGTALGDAVAAVDAATGGSPAYYGINCAHPSHFGSAIPGAEAGARIRCVRANASRKSHAEIDASPDLDEGDPADLAADYLRLRASHPALAVLGGCCGTDARHIEAIAAAFART